ncbi:MAG: GNAT family N-acetyltransferase [Alsobacter sp.]
MTADVRLLSPAQINQRLPELADVLVDCVHGGASIGFMEPFSHAEAVSYFAEIAESVQAGERVLFAAMLDGKVVGTVQLVIRQPANQPHRAEISKIMVHRGARGRWIGVMLMQAAERHATALGRKLITLDTATPEAARLYRRLNYTEAGSIPNFALFPDGRPCATTFFFKELAA